MSGECCQWVLDIVCKTIEWLRQPLGFEVPHSPRITRFSETVLTIAAPRLSLKSQTMSSSKLQPRMTTGASVFLDNRYIHLLPTSPFTDSISLTES